MHLFKCATTHSLNALYSRVICIGRPGMVSAIKNNNIIFELQYC